MRAFYVSSFLGEPPFSHFVSISNYIRGKVSRLASRGRGYKFDVDMDMESNISAYLVSSSFSRRSSSGRTFFRLSLGCSFRWQNRLWFVPGFNLKIVRRSKQYARKPFFRTPQNRLLRLYVVSSILKREVAHLVRILFLLFFFSFILNFKKNIKREKKVFHLLIKIS